MVPDNPLQTISKDAITTILVAKHTKTPLFADDARLRYYAEKELAVPGFWSQSLLTCVIRSMPTSESGGSRPVNPKHVDQ